MKKIIAVLLIATFMLSTVVYAKEDVGKEFELDFLVQVGQQYIDGFYGNDEQINNEEYIVTDKNIPVYSIDKDVMAYILEVQNKNGDEIGYVMVGSNERSPVILEASIDEGLIGYLLKEGKNTKVIYIAPLKLAFTNNGIAKNEKQYIDVRTKQSFDYEFVESESKMSKEELQEKNKKNWEMIEEISLSSTTDAAQLNALASTYISPTRVGILARIHQVTHVDQ